MGFLTALPLVALLGLASAKYPPAPSGLTIVNSTKHTGASISFKQTSICETTDGVKGYSGFVNLPAAPAEGRPYELHTWFWFFEARKDSKNAPLALWLQGGPGAPSSPAAVGENGPCDILSNSRDTVLNPWSWNNEVNMLYIDQPVQTGFSYDTLIKATINEIKSPFSVAKSNTTNSTSLAGVFSSQNTTLAPSATGAVAVDMWNVLQLWFQEFPGYKSPANKLSIWAESYGGHYAPTFTDFINKQNARIASGELSAKTATPIHVETVGLINACIDLETQMPFYPVMAANNTYGIRVFDDKQYAASVAALPECLNQTRTCRALADKLDPQGWGNVTEVNTACLGAYLGCFDKVAQETPTGALAYGGYHFDIAVNQTNSFPPKWAAGWFNTAEVQSALGVPLNWTGNSDAISRNFALAGDFVKGHNLAILGDLLDQGVKVSLMYGDRDYQCNWFGGEALSLAIQAKVAPEFKKAGYAELETNSSYVGGLVRQYGNLSFARVYQAGHEVPHYQPETAYQIFHRVTFNQDVATGSQSVHSADNSTHVYATSGNTSALTTGDVATGIDHIVHCYFWDIMETCTPAQRDMFANGSAITHDFIMIGYKLADGTEVMYNASQGGVDATPTTTAGPAATTSHTAGSGAGRNAVTGVLGVVAMVVFQLL